MPWIESHDDIWDHWKTLKLCDLLGRKDYAVVGHLTSLWHFVLRNAWRDANLEKWGDQGIERAARWDGEPGVFVKALREAGYLDGSVAHDWLERAGKLVNDRLYNDQRKKYAVIRRKSDATLPNPTLPNPTQPNDKRDPKAGSKPKGFKAPSLSDVGAYCKERRNNVDPEKWLAHYQSNGWRVGRNPMRDWKAAIRTWERNSGTFGGSKANGGVVGEARPIPGKYANR